MSVPVLLLDATWRIDRVIGVNHACSLLVSSEAIAASAEIAHVMHSPSITVEIPSVIARITVVNKRRERTPGCNARRVRRARRPRLPVRHRWSTVRRARRLRRPPGAVLAWRREHVAQSRRLVQGAQQHQSGPLPRPDGRPFRLAAAARAVPAVVRTDAGRLDPPVRPGVGAVPRRLRICTARPEGRPRATLEHGVH